jgi:hypothetical protein
MTEIECTPTTLIIHIQGIDKLLTFKSQLNIPLTHVTAAEVAAISEQEWTSWNVLRVAGTALPGIIRAGSFLQHGEWVFWDVRNLERVVTIHLTSEQFVKLVVEVEDPVATVAAINKAIDLQSRS